MATKDLDNVDSVRKLSTQEIDALNKPDLKKALKTAIVAPSSEISGKLDFIINELKDLKTEREAISKEMQYLRNENTELRDALMQHQRYLEVIEAEKLT